MYSYGSGDRWPLYRHGHNDFCGAITTILATTHALQSNILTKETPSMKAPAVTAIKYFCQKSIFLLISYL